MKYNIQYVVDGRCKSENKDIPLRAFYYEHLEGDNMALLREKNKYQVEEKAESILRSEFERKYGKSPDSVHGIRVSW